MSYGWHEHPTKAAVKHFVGGDEPRVVYAIGQYEVTVPGAEVAITYRVPSHASADPRQSFPNMEVRDGEIRLPVVDLVSEVLSRLDPIELAQALWQNDEVKAAFVDCMVERYSQQGVDDADRRKVLLGLKETVHSVALDKLASAAASMEYAVTREANHYDEVRRINETLRAYDFKVNRVVYDDQGKSTGTGDVLLQFDDRERREKTPAGGWTFGQFEIGGRVWNEARDHWRETVVKHFPAPKADPEPAL
jgi:hypothetical protein